MDRDVPNQLRDFSIEALEADVDEEKADQHRQDGAIQDQIGAAADAQRMSNDDGDRGARDRRRRGDPNQ